MSKTQENQPPEEEQPAEDLYTIALKPDAEREDIRAAFFDACGEGRMDIFNALLPRVRDDIDMHGIVCKETTLTMAAFTGQAEIVKRLLDLGADPLLRNEGGYSPIHLAAERGDANVVAMLIDHGGYNEERTRLGRTTPLELAAQQGRLGVLRGMAEKGVDLDTRNDMGMTALHMAVLYKRPDSVYALLSLGANPDIRDKDDRTAEDMSQFVNYRAAQRGFNEWRSIAHGQRMKRAARHRNGKRIAPAP